MQSKLTFSDYVIFKLNFHITRFTIYFQTHGLRNLKCIFKFRNKTIVLSINTFKII